MKKHWSEDLFRALLRTILLASAILGLAACLRVSNDASPSPSPNAAAEQAGRASDALDQQERDAHFPPVIRRAVEEQNARRAAAREARAQQDEADRQTLEDAARESPEAFRRELNRQSIRRQERISSDFGEIPMPPPGSIHTYRDPATGGSVGGTFDPSTVNH